MNYTPAQQEAISARGSNLLVSAAAGSGKTAVLAARIVSLAKEGVPTHTVVRFEDGMLKAMYGQTPVDLLYCGANVFAAVSPEDHSRRISTFRFYVRDGRAWGVKCYTRIYQRVDG